jgi:hypothetical protein
MQAIYFDKKYHNLTTARLWWAQHKHMFDTREQLMSYALHKMSRPVMKAVRRIRGGASSHSSMASVWPPSRKPTESPDRSTVHGRAVLRDSAETRPH